MSNIYCIWYLSDIYLYLHLESVCAYLFDKDSVYEQTKHL